jgi:hypothetical protein
MRCQGVRTHQLDFKGRLGANTFVKQYHTALVINPDIGTFLWDVRHGNMQCLCSGPRYCVQDLWEVHDSFSGESNDLACCQHSDQ